MGCNMACNMGCNMACDVGIILHRNVLYTHTYSYELKHMNHDVVPAAFAKNSGKFR